MTGPIIKECVTPQKWWKATHTHTLKVEDPKNNGNRKHVSGGRCFFFL